MHNVADLQHLKNGKNLEKHISFLLKNVAVFSMHIATCKKKFFINLPLNIK